MECPARETSRFCGLGKDALADLKSFRCPSAYPAGAVLFAEGQPCHGVFILCSGRAKLTVSSPRGRSAIIRVADAGDVVGLISALSGGAYGATAHTLEQSEVCYLPREDLRRLQERHAEVSLRIAALLGQELRGAYQRMGRFILTPGVAGRLAGVLLDASAGHRQSSRAPYRLRLGLTHEEVADLIGSTRPTVTRLLGQFRDEGIIRTRGAWVTVLDPARLRALLG